MSNRDPNQDPDLEKLIQAICWKLGLIENDNSDDLKDKWNEFRDHFKDDKFMEKFKIKIRQILKKEPQLPETDFSPETEASSSTQDVKSPTNSSSTDHKNLANKSSGNPDPPELENSDNRSNLSINETDQNSPQHQPNIKALANSKTQETPYRESDLQQLNQHKAASTPIAPPWQYRPVPDKDKEPTPHDEFYSKSAQSSEELKLIGARVRGKLHKHQGTNCDDWFEFDTIGKWTIIAVSDGAGSKKFSRIGAKISCQAAVKSLKNDLQSFSLCERAKTDLENDFSRDDKWMFKGEKARQLQESLYKALKDAYGQIENEANRLKNYRSYNQAVGKKELDIKDFSATLLLAIHTTIQVGDSSYDFVLTCQVGDGMLAAISHEYTLKLLGKPDIGEHGGQTDFLTSDRKLETSNLVQKTFPFIGNLKALMIMTDGVSDDYFPNYPGMFELYGDLILNQVINFPGIDSKEREKQLQSTNLKTQDDVRNIPENFQDEVERILASDSEEPKKVSIRSIAKYAEQLGKDIKEVLTSPDLLNAGILTKQMCPECDKMESYEKLKIWLDSYYRRGSFDDRTLVVLYREEN